jgi:hypothetical protein
MIADDKRTVLISSMGWVDRNELWTFSTGTETARRVSIGSPAKYLAPHVGTDGYFSVAHHSDGPRFEVTVHAFVDPSAAIARATVTDAGGVLAGDVAAWTCVPRLYVAYIKLSGFEDFALFRIDPARGTVDVQRLGWYDDRFDKGYQGVVSVTELPGADLAIFSVQRSSELVLHDLRDGVQRGVVQLAGRGGNPTLRFRSGASEVWASDYDTLLKLDPSSWRVVSASRLQDAAAGTRQFIGDFAFDPDETICAVARPFSGDIVGLDPSTMKVRWTTNVGRQPLEVAVLPDRRVIARDWKTGETLRGVLKHRWFR